MSEIFKYVDRKTYRNYMELMQTLVALGFNNEFDNSLIMRELSKRVENIWKTTGISGGVYVTTLCGMCPNDGLYLRVTLTSSSRNSVQETISLIEREDGSLALATNVLQENQLASWHDIPTIPTWFSQVEVDGVDHAFKAWATTKDNIIPPMPAAIKALMHSLAPKGFLNQCRVDLTYHIAKKISAAIFLAGKQVATLEFPLEGDKISDSPIK